MKYSLLQFKSFVSNKPPNGKHSELNKKLKTCGAFNKFPDIFDTGI